MEKVKVTLYLAREVYELLRRTAFAQRRKHSAMAEEALLTYLKPKTEGFQTAIASESALKKIWMTPEEDSAWQDL